MIKLYSDFKTVSVFPKESFQEYEFYHSLLPVKDNSLIYLFTVMGDINSSFFIWLEDIKDEISLKEQLADFDVGFDNFTYLKLLTLEEQEYFKTGKIEKLEDNNDSYSVDELSSFDQEQLIEIYNNSYLAYPTEKSLLLFQFVNIYDVYSWLKFLALNINIANMENFLCILNKIEDNAILFQDYNPYKLYESCCLNKDYFEFLRNMGVDIFYDSFMMKAIRMKKVETIEYLKKFCKESSIFTPFLETKKIGIDENTGEISELNENLKEVLFEIPLHSFYILKYRDEKTLKYHAIANFSLEECIKFVKDSTFSVGKLGNGYSIRSEKSLIILYDRKYTKN